jgi:hypothetical protein
MTFELITEQQPLSILEDAAQIRSTINNLVATVKGLVINSDDTFRSGTSLWRAARDWKKSIETQRKFLTEPYRKKTTEINDRAKEVTVPLEEIESLIKSKIDLYQKAIEEQRSATIAQHREAESLLDIVVDINVPQIDSMRGPGATVYKTTRQKINVVDISLVPAKYIMINEKAVEADLKMGIIIPGIEMIEEQITQIRSR